MLAWLAGVGCEGGAGFAGAGVENGFANATFGAVFFLVGCRLRWLADICGTSFHPLSLSRSAWVTGLRVFSGLAVGIDCWPLAGGMPAGIGGCAGIGVITAA